MLGRFVLLAVVVGGFSQEPSPCQSPRQWEGQETLVAQETNSEERRREYNQLYYDEINMRERKIAKIEIGSNTIFLDILSLYREGKEYILNLKSRECKVTALTRPFHYRGILPGSKFQYTANLGSSSHSHHHVAVQVFAKESNEEYTMSSVTYPGCLPVQNTHFSKQTGYEESNYFDIKAGISNPMTFEPPEECVG